MRRRERKCGVAFARINTSRARAREIRAFDGRFRRRNIAFRGGKAPFLNLSSICNHKADLFLVISDSIRSEKFYVFTMIMMLTKRVLSLSSLHDNFKQVNFKTSKRVATKARAGFSVNAAAVRFSSSISCFG